MYALWKGSQQPHSPLLALLHQLISHLLFHILLQEGVPIGPGVDGLCTLFQENGMVIS